MRQVLLAVGAACLLAGCALSPAQKTVALQVGCAVDGVVQPLALPVVASLGAAGTSVATADALLVHPAVVAACAQLGGKPAVVAASAAAPPMVTAASPGATGPTK